MMGFFVTLPYFMQLYIISKIVQPVTLFPSEIVTRWHHRAVSIVLVFLSGLMFLHWLDLTLRDQEDLFMFLIVKIIYYESCVVLSIEYFLCTASIPPEEKEFRKEESRLKLNS